MPDKETLERAEKDKREGKSPSTQAGEFVREEMHHVREGKHGVRNVKQAIAIGLSKARRAGVELPTRNRQDAREEARAQSGTRPSRRRARAVRGALKREGRAGASHRALARQAHQAARRRTRSQRSQAARRAAATRRRTRS
ncbi:MAG TPA: DUF6496 domain-containing protein [Gemmatimonadales bacterium]|nr:DUF6496 domain-containing protein [Gemmatimonadales bacterium]